MFVRSLVVWLALLALAFLNAGLREAVFTPRFGTTVGHALSTCTLCALILLLTAATIQWIAPPDSAAAWTVGLTWLLLVLAFEFLAGHYLFGTSWSTLLADYNVMRGRVWVLVLLTTLTAPVLMIGLLRSLRG